MTVGWMWVWLAQAVGAAVPQPTAPAAAAGAAPSLAAAAAMPEDFFSGPLCGLYCVYSCLRLAGQTVDFSELATPKYKSSAAGSSARDLEKALADHGIASRTLANLDVPFLRSVGHPVILHARQPGHGSDYVHWLLCLGHDGEAFRVVDPPKAKVFRVADAELLAMIDGNGVVVRLNEGNETLAAGASLVVKGALALGALLTLLVGELAARRFGWGVGKVFSFGLAAALFGALAFHLLSPWGLLRHADAAGQIRDQRYFLETPTTDLGEVARASQGGGILIDTRLARDFARGTIAGAKSLPITANSFERKALLQGIPRESRLILFCQSKGCTWSGEMASYLQWQGFKNVAVYADGYRGWQMAREAKPSP